MGPSLGFLGVFFVWFCWVFFKLKITYSSPGISFGWVSWSWTLTSNFSDPPLLPPRDDLSASLPLSVTLEDFPTASDLSYWEISCEWSYKENTERMKGESNWPLAEQHHTVPHLPRSEEEHDTLCSSALELSFPWARKLVINRKPCENSMACDEMACSASLIITAWILNELPKREPLPSSPVLGFQNRYFFLLWVEQELVAWKLETKMKEN